MEDIIINPDGYTLLTGSSPNKTIICPDKDIKAKCTDSGDVEITLLRGKILKR